MTEITMPKLSDTMTEGRLVSWKKSVGERVERGDIIAEVETDKANMELEAFGSGILVETRAKPGDQVAVGTVIGVIGTGEEAVTPPAPPPSSKEPPPAPVSEPKGSEVAPVEPAPVPAEPEPVPPPAESHEGRAAPAVRRHARDLGIDLEQVPGSGPGGRILMEDLERFTGVSLRGVETAPSTPEPDVPVTVESGEPVREAPPGGGEGLSRMRAAIVRTVTTSWQNIPHFSVTVEVDMDAAEEVRHQLKEAGTPLTVNDLVVKAAALSLRQFPRVNASFSDGRIVDHGTIDIGMAVSLPDGLLVPVIRRCDTLPLGEIAVESRRLVTAARSGKLTEAELSGGTFTVSNLGMYGVTSFAAVILPPQAAILAVGAVRETVVPRKGVPSLGQVMSLTLSADHRLLDGAIAARFLGELRRLLEAPVLLL